MKKEDIDLLVKDLSARIPYGVKFRTTETGTTTLKSIGISSMGLVYVNMFLKKPEFYLVNEFGNLEYKPLLRSLSSITQDEIKELNTKFVHIGYFFINNPKNFDGLRMQHADMDAVDISEFIEVYEWLNAHHFDYRGLIEKGLAIEASKDMYENLTK